MARNRYISYAKIAKKEGYVFVSRVFLETAENEKEHAENFFEFIKEFGKKSIKVEAEVPLIFSNTAEYLKAAIEGEHTKIPKCIRVLLMLRKRRDTQKLPLNSRRLQRLRCIMRIDTELFWRH